MSEHLLEPNEGKVDTFPPGRRHHAGSENCLCLYELNPDDVVDRLAQEGALVEAISFGAVRETCPKCEKSHLQLVLRQHAVRIPHLFCDNCASCFDASYPNGAPALTI